MCEHSNDFTQFDELSITFSLNLRQTDAFDERTCIDVHKIHKKFSFHSHLKDGAKLAALHSAVILISCWKDRMTESDTNWMTSRRCREKILFMEYNQMIRLLFRFTWSNGERIFEDENDWVTAKKELRNETIFVDRFSFFLLSFAGFRYFSPHFLHVFQNHITMTIKCFDTGQ